MSAWFLVEIWQAVVSFSLFLFLFVVACIFVKINNSWGEKIAFHDYNVVFCMKAIPIVTTMIVLKKLISL